jgi:hypothetical protein
VNRPTRLALAAAVLLPALMSTRPAFADDEESSSPSESASDTPTEQGSQPTGEPTGDPKSGLSGVEDLTPISGGNTGSTAPTIETGRYIDTAPDMETLKAYKFQRTIPGSTLTYGVTLLGDDINSKNRLVVRLVADQDGPVNVSCGLGRLDPDDHGTTMPLSTVAGWSWSRKECESADVLYLVVQNATQSRFTKRKQKVPTGTPYEVDIWEQPPISNVSDLKASLSTAWIYADADDPQVQAEPGVSMSEAVPLPDGETAAVDLPLGKISWFYVPVELGERLQVLVETADGGSIAGAGLEVRILSPVGGLIDEVDPTTILPAKRSTNLAAGPGLVSTITFEVDPGLRFWEGAEHSRYSHNMALTSSAGNYLVAVYAQKLSGTSVSSLPVTIKAQTDPHETYAGDKYTLPKYIGDFPPYPAPSGPQPEPYDPDAAEKPAPSSAGRSAEEWALIGGLGGAALVSGLLGLVLVRRRG